MKYRATKRLSTGGKQSVPELSEKDESHLQKEILKEFNKKKEEL